MGSFCLYALAYLRFQYTLSDSVTWSLPEESVDVLCSPITGASSAGHTAIQGSLRMCSESHQTSLLCWPHKPEVILGSEAPLNLPEGSLGQGGSRQEKANFAEICIFTGLQEYSKSFASYKSFQILRVAGET